MEDQPKFPDLTDAERKALEELMPDEMGEIITSGMKRRHFLKLISFTGTGLLAAHLLGIEQLMARSTTGTPLPPAGIENGVNVSFKVNGNTQKLLVDSRMTLLDTLRERLELTGSKKGCDHGQCGACTVIIDDRRVLSCLTLAATCEDKEVTTIEGLSDGNNLHPMQAAFIKHDGFQCGYCTPGQICSAVALVGEAKRGEASYVTSNVRQTGKSLKLSDEEIRERMSGNICRCGAYPNIVDAIREVHGDKAVARFGNLLTALFNHIKQSSIMRPFKFSNAADPGTAITIVSSNPGAKFLGGGTNLLDLMKEDVMHPSELVNISRLKHADIEKTANGISIGATATNSFTANHERIRKNYPLLSMAILAGASAQIRNMATNGGNLIQRTRCTYFYDVNMPCNKREPGSGCGALKGVNRNHAIFGWSEKCVAVYPSDMAVALAALDAVVHVEDKNNTKRTIPFTDFHRLPGNNPEIENTLKHGELITSIELPENDLAEHSYYLKIRERSSYAFALVSVAAAMSLDGNKIKDVRIALGGVAHKPWRATVAEKLLKGMEANETNFKAAAAAELKSAKPLEHNKYKVKMAGDAIVRALSNALTGAGYGMEAGL